MSRKLPPVHPGEHVKEFVEECGLTMNRLAQDLHVPANRITEIIHGRRGITAETALRLGYYFGTSPQMWINLQAHYDMEVAKDKFDSRIRMAVKPRTAAA